MSYSVGGQFIHFSDGGSESSQRKKDSIEMVDIVKESAMNLDSSSDEDQTQRKRINIVPALIKAFGAKFFIAILLKVVQDLLKFVSPQILKLLIKYVQRERKEEEEEAVGTYVRDHYHF